MPTAELLTALGVFCTGVVASVIGTLVGGGSLLSIAVLISLGLPPQVAIATDRFGSLGQTITAFLKFFKAKRIAWKYVPLFAILSFIGSLVGANILLAVDPHLLKNIVGILIFLLVPTLFVKKAVGTERGNVTQLKIILGGFLYLAVQVLTGFLGGGTGALIFTILMMCFGLTIIEAGATQLLPVFVLNISSVAIFAMHGIIDYTLGISLLAGMATGGHVGAHIALKKGDTWVKQAFFVLLVVMGVKLLFF